jgi:hypothetical protein
MEKSALTPHPNPEVLIPQNFPGQSAGRSKERKPKNFFA